MKFPIVLLSAFLLGCTTSPSTSPRTNSAAKADTIVSVRFLLDTVIVDANPTTNHFPLAIATSDSTLHVEQLVGVYCGYAGYGFGQTHDTLVVRASHPTSGACVDWMAQFQLVADIQITGTCRHVHFLTGSNLRSTSLDTVIAL